MIIFPEILKKALFFLHFYQSIPYICPVKPRRQREQTYFNLTYPLKNYAESPLKMSSEAKRR